MNNTGWIERNWRDTIFPIILLGCLILFSHFLFASDFGLIGDDAWRVVHPYRFPLTIKTVIPTLLKEFSIFLEGRPLGFFIPQLLVSVFRVFKSLPGIFYLGSSVLILNAALFYAIVFRLSRNRFLSFLSAVIFSVYPADTTQSFLTHIFHIQTALTFLLLAFLSYLHRQKWLAFVFAACVLLDYETPYWLFIVAPLLESDFVFNKTLRKKLLSHSALMVVLFAVYFVIRIFAGENRMDMLVGGSYQGLSFVDLPLNTVFVMAIGPFYSLFSFLAGPYDALRHLTITTLVGIGLSLSVFYVILSLFFQQPAQACRVRLTIVKGLVVSSDPSVIGALKLIRLAVIAFPFTYVMAIHLQGGPIVLGKTTSVHMTSAFPGALLVASLLYIFYYWLSKKGFRTWALLGMAGFLSIIFGYRLWIQQDYRLASLKFSRMAAQVLPQIQDVGPDTLVIVDARPLEDTTYYPAYGNTFVFFSMLNNIYALPPEFQPDLAILHGPSQVDQEFYFSEGNYYFDTQVFHPGRGAHRIEDGGVILITWDGEQFVRQYEESFYNDISLKPHGVPTLPDFQRTSVFDWYYYPELQDLSGPLEHPVIWNSE
jgi:hypothetical protein